MIKKTDYFLKSVLPKRPYIRDEWLEEAQEKAIVSEQQKDGRIKVWIYVKEFDKYLRVVFLEDAETVHNAFFDRTFRKR